VYKFAVFDHGAKTANLQCNDTDVLYLTLFAGLCASFVSTGVVVVVTNSRRLIVVFFVAF
jgi:hypothetical protein